MLKEEERLADSSGETPVGPIRTIGNGRIVAGQHDADDDGVGPRQRIRRGVVGRSRHELERAAIEGRPARVADISAVAVRVTVVRVGDIPVPMISVRAVGNAPRVRVFTVVFTARAMGDPCPRRLQGQHGQQQQDDRSFHGRGL